MINASPEPFSNWTASIAEDVAVFGGLWAALHYPVAFLIALAVMLALMIWLLPKLIRLIYRAVTRIIEWFRGTPQPTV